MLRVDGGNVGVVVDADSVPVVEWSPAVESVGFVDPLWAVGAR